MKNKVSIYIVQPPGKMLLHCPVSWEEVLGYKFSRSLQHDNRPPRKRIFREEATSALAGFHAGPLSWSNWNLDMLLFFCGGGKPETQRKTIGARREPTTNSTLIWHRARIELRPHWWEASALATAPTLLPRDMI